MAKVLFSGSGLIFPNFSTVEKKNASTTITMEHQQSVCVCQHQVLRDKHKHNIWQSVADQLGWLGSCYSVSSNALRLKSLEQCHRHPKIHP